MPSTTRRSGVPASGVWSLLWNYGAKYAQTMAWTVRLESGAGLQDVLSGCERFRQRAAINQPPTSYRVPLRMNFAFPTPVRRSALAIAGFFLSITALSWVTFDRIKYIYLESGKAGLAGKALAGLTAADAGLLVLAATTGIGVLAFGFRNRALARLFAGEHPRWLYLVTAVLLVWLGHAVLAPGLLVTGDAGTHVARVSHLAAALRGGDSLYWDNYFFGGSTLLQFTGPLFHWLAAATTLAVGDATEAIKVVVSLARSVAALFIFLLVRKLGAGRPAACLTALFYGGAFQLTYMEVVRSSFPQLINFAAMPAVLYGIECLWVRPTLLGRPAAGIALAAICLIGSHQPTAMIFAGYAALFVTARIAMDRNRLAAIPGLLGAAAAVALGSCFFLLPFAMERGMTADNFSTGSLIGLALPAVATLRTFVVWGSAGEGAEYATYLGLPMLLCLAAGGALTVARRGAVGLQQAWVLVFGLALLSLFVRGAYVRHATFTLLFLCVAAGLGVEMILNAAPRRRVLPLLLFAVVVLDSAPLAIQPWTRSDLHAIVAAGDHLAQRAATSRILEVWYSSGHPDVSVGPDSSPFAYARVQMLSGPHKQDATPAHNAGAAILKVAAADLKATGTLSNSTRGLLALANIGWIVGTGPTKPGLPAAFGDTLLDPLLGSYWRIPEATPFVVSGKLELADRPASFDVAPFWNTTFGDATAETREALDAVKRFATQMEADPAAHRARVLLVPAIPDGEEWQPRTEAPRLVRPLVYKVEPGRVTLSLESDRPGFIRLVHPMAASISVSRDGVPVQAIADVESLIVLPIHAGTNDIVVTAAPSLLRRISLWLAIATVALLALRLCAGTRQRPEN